MLVHTFQDRNSVFEVILAEPMEAKGSVTWEEGRGSDHIHPEWTTLLGVLVSYFRLVWSLLSRCCF